jgi:hypothetical protein
LVRRPLTGLLYQPRTIDDECGAVGGMRIGRKNRSTRRKPAPVPLCPPQIPHDLTWDRTLAAAVGSRRAMSRPEKLGNFSQRRNLQALLGETSKNSPNNFLVSADLDTCPLHLAGRQTSNRYSISVLEFLNFPHVREGRS